MIAGIGLDVVSISSFAELVALRDGAEPPFVVNTFTDDERAYCVSGSSGREVHFAARFAAKEAMLKALDACAARVGVQAPSVALSEIEVMRDAVGRPSIALHGAARAFSDALLLAPAHVSLTHDGNIASAMVVLEHGAVDARAGKAP